MSIHAKRLETVLVPDILEHKSVVWHGECRCWCTLQKSCDLAAKKRMAGMSAETQDNDEHDNVSAAAPGYLRRSRGSTFNYMTRCIICEKPFTKHERELALQ